MGHKKRKDRDQDSESSSEPDSEDTTSSDEERHGKHKKDKEKSHKKDKKKHKKHKKHKSREKGKEKVKGEDKDMLKAAKEFLKQQLASKPAAVAPVADQPQQQVADSQKITEDDYFLKSNEFMAWLQEYRQLLFNELSTEEARRLFVDFVHEWNMGKVSTKYYAGLVQAPVRRTAHQWGFAKGGAAPAKGMAAFVDDQRERESSQREADRLDRRKRAVEQRELLEELVPRATGKDAIAEKRVARREEARARDASPDRAFLPGGGNIMGGDDSFAAAKAWEARKADSQRNRQLLKREEVMQKVAQEQAKEDDKMAQFRALISQGPITIAKRS